MLNIIKRIFIGVAIALIVFLIKDTCFAATTVQAFQYRTKYFPCTEHIVLDQTVCIVSGIESTSSLTTFGTGTTGPKILTGSTVQVVTNSDVTQQFIQGQYCTFTWTTNFNPKTSNAVLSFPESLFTLKYWNGSDYVEFSDGRASCSNDPNSNYGMKCVAAWTVPTTSRYLNIQIDYPQEIARLSNQGINFRDGKVNCSTDPTVEAIGIQTGVITGAIDSGIAGIVKHMTDIYNELVANWTEPSFIQKVYDLPSQYGSVESQVESIAGSGHGIGEELEVDYTDFSGVFSWLWFMVNRIVSWNNKFFFILTSCLTLSFVGLVFGR